MSHCHLSSQVARGNSGAGPCHLPLLKQVRNGHMSASGLTRNGRGCTMATNYASKKSPDYWALHPTTGLFTRLLGFSPGDRALRPTIGLCIRRLGFAPDDWAFIRIPTESEKNRSEKAKRAAGRIKARDIDTSVEAY